MDRRNRNWEKDFLRQRNDVQTKTVREIASCPWRRVTGAMQDEERPSDWLFLVNYNSLEFKLLIAIYK